MKKFRIILMALVFIVFGFSSASGAVIELFDDYYGAILNLNDDGVSDPSTVYYYEGDGLYDIDGNQVPGLDDGDFDWTTGLGELRLTYAPGAGDYYTHAFFDHEIDQDTNTYYNEYGSTGGTLATGQSWEIDEPKFDYGDIVDHVELPWTYGFLDNSNGVPSSLPDDVSMAVGWNFSLAVNEYAIISFLVSETETVPGFYLKQYDPDSDTSIYLSSTLTVIPEPTTMLLLGSGLIGLAGFRRRFWKR